MKAPFTTLTAALALAAALAIAPAAAQDTPVAGGAGDLSPVKILLTMKKVYGRCASYRDTGEVTTASKVEGGSFGSRQPFATAFVRSGGFLFRYTDTGLGERQNTYTVWLGDGGVLAWWDASPGLRRSPSLEEALDAASGVSSGASVRVPGLLMPEKVRGGAFLIAPERLADADDRGTACVRLRGRSRETPYTLTTGTGTVTVEDEHVTLWIDASSFLLRRVEQQQVLSTYRTTITTTYDPRMDVEVPPADLTFTPPETPGGGQ